LRPLVTEVPRPCATSAVSSSSPSRSAHEPEAAPSPFSEGSVAGSQAARAVEELSRGDMKLLFALQVKNKGLRAELGIGDGDLSEVDDQVQAQVDLLSSSIAQHQKLQEELQAARTALSESRQQLVDKIPSASPRRVATMVSSDGDLRVAALTAGIQMFTQGNLELIARYDEQIRSMEAELQHARDLQLQGLYSPDPRAQFTLKKQREELRALEQDCEALTKDIERREASSLQALQLEHEVQVEEIASLKQILDGGAAPAMPPGTSVLRDEVGQLGSQLQEARARDEQEQAASDQHVADLSAETSQLELELERTLSEIGAVEAELQALDGAQSSAAAADRELRDLQAEQLSLQSEIGRRRRRVSFSEEKMQQLRDEADDLRSRAQHIWEAIPAAAAADNPPDLITKLQEALSLLQLKIQASRRLELALQGEEEKAKQALGTAQVDVAVLEQRMAPAAVPATAC